MTADGAEVIIPNGDMLSQKLINWTLSNSHIRVQILIKLLNARDAVKVKQLTLEVLGNNGEVMTKPDPQIIIRTLNRSGAELEILFWAVDINKWVELKSDILEQIYERSSSENIEVV